MCVIWTYGHGHHMYIQKWTSNEHTEMGVKWTYGNGCQMDVRMWTSYVRTEMGILLHMSFVRWVLDNTWTYGFEYHMDIWLWTSLGQSNFNMKIIYN